MSQAQILETIEQNPGILQCELNVKMGIPKGTATNQVLKLIKRNEIKRVKHERTYKLYTNGDKQ